MFYLHAFQSWNRNFWDNWQKKQLRQGGCAQVKLTKCKGTRRCATETNYITTGIPALFRILHILTGTFLLFAHARYVRHPSPWVSLRSSMPVDRSDRNNFFQTCQRHTCQIQNFLWKLHLQIPTPGKTSDLNQQQILPLKASWQYAHQLPGSVCDWGRPDKKAVTTSCIISGTHLSQDSPDKNTMRLQRASQLSRK